ncbi:hypothetical protein [Oceanobacillus sp. Castelsardo]|uniref:hypothetical protein n=1 Tax=Oceanobacillus sp. Castelsardo TaxID=1851204 RepID=UPI000837C0F7|nr:hypothetical protein [Oceanobacillus sp. Castelsardo]
MSKKDFPSELQKKLDEFQVDVPEIPIKRTMLDSIANYIYAPAKNPLEIFHIKGNSITGLIWYPFILIFVLFFAPIFFI